MMNKNTILMVQKQEKKWFRLWLVSAVLFCIAYFNFVSRGYYYTLACSHINNQCIISENHVFDNNKPEQREVLLSDVQEMRLHTNDNQQHRLYLYVNSEPIPIDYDWTNEYYDYQTETVTGFQKFLKSEQESTFSYHSKRTQAFKRAIMALIVFFLITLGIMVVYARHYNHRLWLEKKQETESNTTNENNK